MSGRWVFVLCALYACESGNEGRTASTTADASSDAVDGVVSGDDAAGSDATSDPSGDPDAAGEDGTTAADGVAEDGGDGALGDDVPLEDTVAGDPSGTPCVSDDTCESGWCVPSAIGQVCVDVCVDQCDPGEACIPAEDSGTDPVFLCVPFEPPDPTLGDDAETSDTTDATDGIEVGDDTANATDVPPADGGPVDDAIVVDADPGADVPGEETVGGDQDSDGDGIPDDEDNLPCLAIYLIVYNDGVSSASLILNDQEVVAPDSFPTSEPITVFINPTTGENTLSLGGKLTGSPTDTLTLVVVDTEGHIYFAVVIQRESGKPDEPSYTFTIDATCP